MKAFLETFFTNIGISLTTIDVREEADDLYVKVETPDSPLLIGIHGKNIESFQHLIGRFAEKKLWRFIHVHLEVNDYMKAKDDRLFSFLEWKIHFIMQNGKTLQIKNLTSFERKKAHNYIAEKKIDWLGTKSEWEGENRMLILHYTWALKTPEKNTLEPKASSRVVKNSDLDTLSEEGVGI
jgi:predicted RNA-binding protein Jag